jgi:hypothetical protein
VFTFNKLTATDASNVPAAPFPPLKGVYFLRFPKFKLPLNYVVKGTVIIGFADPPQTFSVLAIDDRLTEMLGRASLDPTTGIAVSVKGTGAERLPVGFMVEISQFPS